MKDFGLDGKFVVDVWDIAQWYYCPRKVYFLRTLKVPITLKKKMKEGSDEHLREVKRLKERKSIFNFLRSEVKAIHYKLKLENEKLGLVGQVDLAIELNNGEIIPVEIKYSDYTEKFIGRKKQLVAYSLLLEEKFKRTIKEGIIYYPAQNKQVSVDISYADKKSLIKDLERIRESIRSEKIPRKANSAKCNYCEVIRYCATL
jgi:CRISPR-associated protein Cas4